VTIPIPPADEIGVRAMFKRVNFGYDVTLRVRSVDLRNEPANLMPINILGFAIAELGAQLQIATGCSTEDLMYAIEGVTRARLGAMDDET